MIDLKTIGLPEISYYQIEVFNNESFGELETDRLWKFEYFNDAKEYLLDYVADKVMEPDFKPTDKPVSDDISIDYIDNERHTTDFICHIDLSSLRNRGDLDETKKEVYLNSLDMYFDVLPIIEDEDKLRKCCKENAEEFLFFGCYYDKNFEEEWQETTSDKLLDVIADDLYKKLTHSYDTGRMANANFVINQIEESYKMLQQTLELKDIRENRER